MSPGQAGRLVDKTSLICCQPMSLTADGAVRTSMQVCNGQVDPGAAVHDNDRDRSAIAATRSQAAGCAGVGAAGASAGGSSCSVAGVVNMGAVIVVRCPWLSVGCGSTLSAGCRQAF